MAEHFSQGPQAHWHAALAQGRILLQRDPADGTVYFPPRLAGPQGQALEWIQARGTGRVYSYTVVHPRPPREAYNVALIDLDEGARIMSRVVGAAAQDLEIGAAVNAVVTRSQEGPLIVCHLA